MRRFFALLAAILTAGGVFLAHDWYAKTHREGPDRYTTLYAWTDAQGQEHFSDREPPAGTPDVRRILVLKPLEQPLALVLQNRLRDSMEQLRERLTSVFSVDPAPVPASPSSTSVSGTHPTIPPKIRKVRRKT